MRRGLCLPMRFAGRAFLCCGCGWPYHRGADLRRAGCLGPRLGGSHVAAASSESGEDCWFFGLYASDGQFAVDASWVDATGAIAAAACESGSLTSAQFVTPMSGDFGTACVMDASGAVAQHVVIEPTGAQPPAGKTQPGTCEPTGGNSAGDTKPGSEEKPGDETKPSENPPPPRLIRRPNRTPSPRPRPSRRLRPRPPKRPSPQQLKPPRSLRPATVTGRLRALPSSS